MPTTLYSLKGKKKETKILKVIKDFHFPPETKTLALELL